MNNNIPTPEEYTKIVEDLVQNKTTELLDRIVSEMKLGRLSCLNTFDNKDKHIVDLAITKLIKTFIYKDWVLIRNFIYHDDNETTVELSWKTIKQHKSDLEEQELYERY